MQVPETKIICRFNARPSYRIGKKKLGFFLNLPTERDESTQISSNPFPVHHLVPDYSYIPPFWIYLGLMFRHAASRAAVNLFGRQAEFHSLNEFTQRERLWKHFGSMQAFVVWIDEELKWG